MAVIYVPVHNRRKNRGRGTTPMAVMYVPVYNRRKNRVREGGELHQWL